MKKSPNGTWDVKVQWKCASRNAIVAGRNRRDFGHAVTDAPLRTRVHALGAPSRRKPTRRVGSAGSDKPQINTTTAHTLAIHGYPWGADTYADTPRDEGRERTSYEENWEKAHKLRFCFHGLSSTAFFLLALCPKFGTFADTPRRSVLRMRLAIRRFQAY